MDHADHISAFDALFKQVSLSDLEQEVQDTEARLRRKLEEHEKVSAEATELQATFTRQSKLVSVLREVGVNQGQPDGGRDVGTEDDEVEGGMTKREIAETILRDADRPLFPREVRDIAIERGWLPNTPNASNQLSVAMNRAATKQDYLVKDDEGRYSLPPAGGRTEPPPTLESFEVDDLLAPNGTGARQ